MVEGLLNRNERYIRRFLAARSGPLILGRTTLDDLFQETAAAAVKGARTLVFENDAHFVAWVSTVARRVINAVLTQQRRNPNSVRIRHGQSSGIGIRESQLISPRRSPSSSVAGRESLTRLHNAIDRLPSEYRSVIRLYTLGGLTMSEVAKRLGKSNGAAFMMLARAMNKLRNAMIEP